MYGLRTSDILVRYYDETVGTSGPAEVAWYLDKVRTSGGPVLDLACGTGRLALLLAREGFHVTAVDRSAGMLARLRAKLRGETPDVRRRIRVVRQPMSRVALASRFGTIICCDAFFHNLTVDEQMDCLQSVAAHLAPEGRFVFNLPNPTCEYLLRSVGSAGKEFTERGRYPLGSDTLVVEQANNADLLSQTITTRLRLTRCNPRGRRLEQGTSTWTTRYLFRWEAVHLLHRCGLEVESLVGNYRNAPVAEGGGLIFTAKRRSGGSPARPRRKTRSLSRQ